MSLLLDLTPLCQYRPESTSIMDAASIVSRSSEGRCKHSCEPEVVFPYEEEIGRLLHTHTRQKTTAFGSQDYNALVYIFGLPHWAVRIQTMLQMFSYVELQCMRHTCKIFSKVGRSRGACFQHDCISVLMYEGSSGGISGRSPLRMSGSTSKTSLTS